MSWLARLEARVAHLSMPLLLGLVLLTASWLTPGQVPPWSGFRQEVLAALGGSLIAWAAWPHVRGRWPLLACLPLGLAAMVWIQWFAGVLFFRQDAITVSAYLVAASLAIIAGRALMQSPLRAQFVAGLSASLLVGGLVSAAIVLWQWATGHALYGWVEYVPFPARPFGNLAQPNHISTLMAMALCALWLRHEGRLASKASRAASSPSASAPGWSRVQPGLTLLLALIILSAMVCTQSRTGWLFVGATTLAFWGLRKRLSLRTPRLVIVLLAAFFAVATQLEPPLRAALQGESMAAARTLGSLRLHHWAGLWEAMQDAPALGFGVNQVSVALTHTAMKHPFTGELITHAHSLGLDWLIEYGWFVGTLALVILTYGIGRLWTQVRDAEGFAWMLAVSAVLLHALLEFPLHYAYFLLPSGLMLGLRLGGAQDAAPAGSTPVAQAMATPTSGRPSRASPAALGFGAGLIAVVSTMTLVCLEYVQVEESMRTLRLATNRVGKPRERDLVVPELRLLDGWRTLLQTAQTPKHPASAHLIQQHEQVAKRFAMYTPWLGYIQVLVLNQQLPQARAWLGYVCYMHQAAVCINEVPLWAYEATLVPGLGQLTRADFAHALGQGVSRRDFVWPESSGTAAPSAPDAPQPGKTSKVMTLP